MVQASLHAELAEVMIHVQVTPAHPVAVRHGTEDWVRLPLETTGLFSEAVQQSPELVHVGFKLDWWRAPACWFVSGLVANPLGQGSGTQSANHLSRVRCKAPVAGLTFLSPRGARKESLRWHTIW